MDEVSDSASGVATTGKTIAALERAYGGDLSSSISGGILASLTGFLGTYGSLYIVGFNGGGSSLSGTLSLFATVSDRPGCMYIVGCGSRYSAGLSSAMARKTFQRVSRGSTLLMSRGGLVPNGCFSCRCLQATISVMLLRRRTRNGLRVESFASALVDQLSFFLCGPRYTFVHVRAPSCRSCGSCLRGVFNVSSSRKGGGRLVAVSSDRIKASTLRLVADIMSQVIFSCEGYGFKRSQRRGPVRLVLSRTRHCVQGSTGCVVQRGVFRGVTQRNEGCSLCLVVSSREPSRLSRAILSRYKGCVIREVRGRMSVGCVCSILPCFDRSCVAGVGRTMPKRTLVFKGYIPVPVVIGMRRTIPTPGDGGYSVGVR